MDLRGKIENISFGVQGEPLATFKLDRTAKVNELLQYDTEQQLNIKITKGGSSRTIRQNNLMWSILTEIDKGMNGYSTENNRWDIYTMGIEQLGAEYKDVELTREAVDVFKTQFRKCRVIEEYANKVILRCFVGSSRFNKSQMGELIDWFIRYAAEMQIPVMAYRDEWEQMFG